MNKKNIILILLLSCFLTIMAMSVWGKKPELSNRIPVETITIYDTNSEKVTKVNESARQEKIINIERSSSEVTYTFYVEITPDNATDLSLNYKVQVGGDKATLTEITYEDWLTSHNKVKREDEVSPAHIHYFSIKFIKQELVRIYFTSNSTDTIQKDYLMFVWTGSNDSEEIDL